MSNKVLHISHVSLPDPRIERIGYLEKKYLNHHLIYVGTGGKSTIFDKIISIKNIRNIFEKGGEKSREIIEQIIRDEKPDFIHVHDIYAAIPFIRLKIPYIYDDHELHFFKFLDIFLNIVNPKNGYLRIFGPQLMFRELKASLEKAIRYYYLTLKIAKKAQAIVTTVPPMRRFYLRFADRVVLVPNFPLKSELPDMSIVYKNFVERSVNDLILGVYTTGNIDLDISSRYPIRNIKPFLDTIEQLAGSPKLHLVIYTKNISSKVLTKYRKITIKGYIPRSKLITEISRYHVGVIPFTPTRSHSVSGSNKAIEYLHAGLPVIMPKTFTGVLELARDFKSLFYTYSKINIRSIHSIVEEVRRTYERINDNSFINILEKIRNKLVMDNYIKSLSIIYSEP